MKEITIKHLQGKGCFKCIVLDDMWCLVSDKHGTMRKMSFKYVQLKYIRVDSVSEWGEF